MGLGMEVVTTIMDEKTARKFKELCRKHNITPSKALRIFAELCVRNGDLPLSDFLGVVDSIAGKWRKIVLGFTLELLAHRQMLSTIGYLLAKDHPELKDAFLRTLTSTQKELNHVERVFGKESSPLTSMFESLKGENGNEA